MAPPTSTACTEAAKKLDLSCRTSSMGRKRLAIISGAGPEAGVDVFQKVLAENRRSCKSRVGRDYETDRDAPYVLLFQVNGIGGPRGNRDLLDTDAAPFKLVWDSMVDTIRKIDLCGIDEFCISCNTLHILEPRIRQFCEEEHIQAKFVSVIDVVERFISRTVAPDALKVSVAIFGTVPTTDVAGISPYRRLGDGAKRQKLDGDANLAQVALLQLSDEARQELSTMINGVKKEGAQKSHADVLARLMKENPADIFIFGCTELPMLIPFMSDTHGHTIVDPGVVLAQELVS